MAIQPIRIVIHGVDKFSEKLSKANKKIKRFGNNVNAIGRKMTIGVTTPIIGFGIAAFKATADFEKSMNRVEALTQASSEEMKKMSTLARQLGRDTQFSAIQAADAMGFLGMTGWKTNQILKGTPHLLNLSAAAGTELARTADIASNIMGAFQIDIKDTKMVTDILASATASANVDLEMLAETFKDFAPLAKQANLSLKDAAVLAGFLGNVGIQGSKAATVTKNMMTRLAKPGSQAVKMLSHFGIKVRDSSGNIIHFSEIFTQLSGVMADLGTADKLAVMDTLFGKRAMAGTAALSGDIGKVNSGFKALNKSMENFEDRAGKMARIMMKGAPGSMARFISAFNGLMIAIGKSGLVESISKKMEKITNWFQKISEVNPKLLDLGTTIAIIIAAIGPLLVLLGSLVLIFGKIGIMIAGFGGIMAVLSFAAPIAGILALIGVIVFLHKKFGFSIKGIINFFLSLLGPFAFIPKFFVNNWEKIISFIKVIWFIFKKFISVLPVIFSPVGKVIQFIIDKISWLNDAIKNILKSLARIVLPKWLEKKLGLTVEENRNIDAQNLTNRTAMVNKNININKLTVEDRAGVKIRAENNQGNIDFDVSRGLNTVGNY